LGLRVCLVVLVGEGAAEEGVEAEEGVGDGVAVA